MTLDQLLENMWTDYCKMNPSAQKIHDLLAAAGNTITNDHIALRTFKHPRLGLASLAKPFEDFGYSAKNEYVFIEKKLYAQHFEHSNPKYPKIFISELELEKVSPFIRQTVARLLSQMPEGIENRSDFSMMGRPWKVSYKEYQQLAQESEYASWVAAYGFRPNHFTVFYNDLSTFKSLEELNTFIKSHGFILNTSGGEIKGTPADFLEQSSTMASEVPIEFTDGVFQIPGCYYEFAKRHKMENGEFYQGFVAKSADKIFESTNAKK